MLADKLGVTYKSVSNWENGRCMMDISLIIPLCKILDISANELLAGECLETNQQFENNIISTIELSNQKIANINNHNLYLLILLAIILLIFTFILYKNHMYTLFILLLAILIIAYSCYHLFKHKYIAGFIAILSCFIMVLVFDYISVKYSLNEPIFAYKISYSDKVIEYNTLLYNAYKINYNSPNEYMLFDGQKQYDESTLPIYFFNPNKAGIENLKQYKNLYVGNNSNDGMIINNLCLSEYGFVFEIKDNGLIINYHMTDWYIDKQYLKQSLIYNSEMLFYLIDNLEYVKYNFVENSYQMTKEDSKYYKTLDEDYDTFIKLLTDNYDNLFNSYFKTDH